MFCDSVPARRNNLKSKDNIEFESLYYENGSEKFEKKDYLDNLTKILKEKQSLIGIS